MAPHPIDRYAADVVAGRLPAGKYHRLACARHQRDRAREATPAFPYRVDLARAERFYRFSEKLKHYKGEWAGQYIRLEPHQQFRLGSIFGWVHVETELRRFRTAFNMIPRKNGKTLEEAIVALYVTFFDHEPGAEGYPIATKRDQAKLAFNAAKQLVVSSGLKTRITALTNNLHCEATQSKLEPLGADANSTDGLNPHFIGVDEFHAHKNRDLIDVMETATGARRQPLNFQITTAGSDLVSPCGDQYTYACNILDQVFDDETFFCFIAHADIEDKDAGVPEDDPFDEATWRKANPNFGVSVKPDDLRALARKASHMPSAAATFKQKRLNLWVNADAPWLSLEGWRRGQSPRGAWTAAELAGETCYAGVDLASKIDLMALSLLFPPTATHARYRVLLWVWTPLDTMKDRAHRDRAPYEVWADQKDLITIPGLRMHHHVIRAALVAARATFTIAGVGADPWHVGSLFHELQADDGFSEELLLEVPQTYAGMSDACRQFEAEVLEGQIDAGGQPVMGWSVANAVVQKDGKDNIYPVKKKSRGKIDPLMATLNARALIAKEKPKKEPEYQLIVLGGAPLS